MSLNSPKLYKTFQQLCSRNQIKSFCFTDSCSQKIHWSSLLVLNNDWFLLRQNKHFYRQWLETWVVVLLNFRKYFVQFLRFRSFVRPAAIFALFVRNFSSFFGLFRQLTSRRASERSRRSSVSRRSNVSAFQKTNRANNIGKSVCNPFFLPRKCILTLRDHSPFGLAKRPLSPKRPKKKLFIEKTFSRRNRKNQSVPNIHQISRPAI